ncbi:ABC transporter ATP-binding protein [Pseudobutyrivibrio xylanivorans]|uniref:ABC-type dipeptide/oligopeptide/nickel transport system, ATPase component n=1 Tax=Pseudobutyrivibrio xylanivorans DSM 14809 TaxID=1123012 RepID=A0A1M6GR60_PSEXY|nr:ABC transporter ATP-binding protein [Pseudobutyrivibrio xylanivorans]SHJ12413.1 ABC-type dipeptide/oligopeptide/nickel transport system, ATPase component [Pseudobutyrivibrio xylanivorans DSM 14809]
MDSLLTYENVEISFEKCPVIHNISFSLHEGEILALVGESGSGKSTLIRSALGLLNDNGKVTGGKISYKGTNLLSLREREMRQIRGAEIGMIFQDAKGSLCPIRTIGDQILESIAAHKNINKADAKSKALELFEKLNFKNPEKLWNSYPFELSGGMNQRAAIAITMLLNPSILLADEPTSALDVAVQKQVVEEILALRELFGSAIIIVTHDISVASAMADTVIVLKDGHMMEYGPAKEILHNPTNDYTKMLLSAVPRLKRRQEIV